MLKSAHLCILVARCTAHAVLATRQKEKQASRKARKAAKLAIELQEEVDSLQPGEVRSREPARAPPKSSSTSRTYGQQALGGFPGNLTESGLPLLARVTSNMRNQRNQGRQEQGEVSEEDELEGTWEKLSLEDGQPLLVRRDVWGLPRENRGIQYGDIKDLS